MKRLYVIGNGFDLHHNLPTGLNNFRDYIKLNHPLEYQNLEYIFHRYDTHIGYNNWNELETMLICTTELDSMLEDAIESSEKDMDRASFWNDIQYNVMRIERDLKLLKENLDNWIVSINISDYKSKEYIHFESDDIFLTFNYTDTLQQLYDVLDAQVIHIHGSSVKEKVLGHNEKYYELRLSNITQEDFENGLEVDWRIEEAKKILNHIPILFYKNSESIIKKNRVFFDTISSCDEIVFMGWSLGLQDAVYMDEILSKIKDGAIINVVYYKDDDKALRNYQQFFERYICNKYKVSYYTWEMVSKLFEC